MNQRRSWGLALTTMLLVFAGLTPAAIAEVSQGHNEGRTIAQPETDSQAPSAASPSSTASSPSLHLICRGVGHRLDNMSGSVVQTEVYLDVAGSKARIKIPDALVPPLHTQAVDGWRNFETFQVTDSEFRGKFKLNFMGHPRVSVSRITGIMVIEVHVEFSGKCLPDDSTPAARLF